MNAEAVRTPVAPLVTIMRRKTDVMTEMRGDFKDQAPREVRSVALLGGPTEYMPLGLLCTCGDVGMQQKIWLRAPVVEGTTEK